MSERIIKYTEAIKEATDQLMQADNSVYVIGLGVSYKNGADGTTAGLKEKYPERIFDVPVSEASVTGMAVGSAINGLKPIVHHGRVEFSLLASDQIFTQAAKWNYMFGGGNNVPIVFRIAVGRQWGNGPQHTQALYPLFGNVIGLKVVIPGTPYMAKGLLIAAVEDPNPVVILEPRWIYGVKQQVPEDYYKVAIDKARIHKKGRDITVVAYGDGFVSCIEALEIIGDKVDVELIDAVSINPIDHKTILNSVKKTSRLICIDTSNSAFSIGSEIISKVAQERSLKLLSTPISIVTPDVPCPTSTSLTEDYYPTKITIADRILEEFNQPKTNIKLSFEELHLSPGITLKDEIK